MTSPSTLAFLRRLNTWRFKGMIHPNLYRERFADMEYLPAIGAYLKARNSVALGFIGMGETLKRSYRREYFEMKAGLPYQKSTGKMARDYLSKGCMYGGPINAKSCCGGKCWTHKNRGGF